MLLKKRLLNQYVLSPVPSVKHRETEVAWLCVEKVLKTSGLPTSLQGLIVVVEGRCGDHKPP